MTEESKALELPPLPAHAAAIAERDAEIEQLKAEIAQLKKHACDAEIARLKGEREALRAFAEDIMAIWPNGGVDGGDLQEMAMEHGLLREKAPRPTEPCGPNCWWEEWLEGVSCFEHTDLVGKRVALVVVEDKACGGQQGRNATPPPPPPPPPPERSVKGR